MSIQYRSGQQQDCSQIANWINSIGHGHIEYLLEGLVQNMGALEHLTQVLNEDLHYSYKNVDLAMEGNSIVGLVFSYSSLSNELKPEMKKLLSEDRIQWMQYFSDNQINNSWYINTLGVSKEYRRQGIAKQLLELAAQRALKNQTQCLSLHVYENNQDAIKLYKSYGFSKEKTIDLTAHPFFVTRNLSANILMKCNVAKV